MGAYNATAYGIDADGKVASTEAVEVDSEGRVIRACGFWSHLNGTPEYEAAWRGAKFSFIVRVEVVHDGAEGYRNALRGLALPPTYLPA